MTDPKPPLSERDLDQYEAWAREDLIGEKRGSLAQQAAARRTLELIAEVRQRRAGGLSDFGDGSVENLERAIVGALRSAIRDHGPITPEWIGSAVKRVVGNLRNDGRGQATAPLRVPYVCQHLRQRRDVDSA